jgi:tetratricopeptide (TPR) repeat protein
MKPNKAIVFTAFSVLVMALAPAHAEESISGLLALQEAWATTYYRTPKAEQKQAYATLEQSSDRLIQQYPGRAEPLVWKAIILSTEAGLLGGFSALDKAKTARDLLLDAEKIDADVLDGSVYTSLGSLYYKVPGWPLGFGSKGKANAYLEKAIAVNPDGIDPNYFLADFRFEQKEFDEAARYAEKALQAPPRDGRPIADEGRRAEVKDLLAKVQQKIAQK